MSFLDFIKQRRIKSRIAAGDPGSIDDLFEFYAGGLYQYAYSFVRCKEDSEEIVQTFFLKLIRNPQLLKSIDNFKAYLYKGVRNLAIDLLKDKQPTFSIDEIIIPHISEDKKEDIITVRDSLKELSPEYQEVLFLKFYKDLSFKEIGILLEIPQNTAASRYRYAINKLRDILKG